MSLTDSLSSTAPTSHQPLRLSQIWATTRGLILIGLPQVLLLVAAIAAHSIRAETPAAEIPLPEYSANLGLDDRDEAFDQRVARIVDEEGFPAAFKSIEKAYQKHPTPHVKSLYGECLINGSHFGAPDHREEEGVKILKEAVDEGSPHAFTAMGWQLLAGVGVPKDVGRGLAYLKRASDAGDATASFYLSVAYATGMGITQSLRAAHQWAVVASLRGKPDGLFAEGQVYEQGNGVPVDIAKACERYLDAASRGCDMASQQIDLLAKNGQEPAKRVQGLLLLRRVAFHWRRTRAQIQPVVDYFEATYPKDPEVLYALGTLYIYGGREEYQDFKKAYALLEKAAALGSLDAQAEQAEMIAEGFGVKRDIGKALDLLLPLAAKKNAKALNYIGVDHYWGLLANEGIYKDEHLAFVYSAAAAEAGDYYAPANLADCYAFGIGVKRDYALAAKYTRIAWIDGVLPHAYANRQIDKFVAFVDP